MIETLYAGMAIPESCRLGKRLFKKQFVANSTLSAADQKAFNEDVDTIYWQHTLKSTTIPIQPYEDAEREYLELNLLQANLRSERRYKRLAEIMHRAIPYPLLLLLCWQEQVALTVADKRINRADSDKIVVEAVYDTGWITLEKSTASQAEFLADFCVTNFSYQNFYAFHQDMVRRIVALNSAAHTGRYALNHRETMSVVKQVARLNQLETLEQEQTEIRNKLKKEKNLGTQVQLNVRMKQLADQIIEIKAAL
jgi:hypothetical protein